MLTAMLDRAEQENILTTPRESLRQSMKDLVLPGNVSSDGDELLAISNTSRTDFTDFLSGSQPAESEGELTRLLNETKFPPESPHSDDPPGSPGDTDGQVSIHTDSL